MNVIQVKQNYFDFCRFYGINPRDVVISAGAACVIYGIRKTTDDVDVDVPSMLFSKLLEIPNIRKHPYEDNPNKIHHFDIGKVSIHRQGSLDKESVFEHDGMWVYTFDQVLIQKKRLNRIKDLQDIALLKQMQSRAIK